MRLSAEQFESILASLKSFDEAGRTVEKRRAPRVGLRMSAAMVRCAQGPAGGKAAAKDVKVRNVSSTGIGLTLPEPILRGEYIILGFGRATGETLTVLYRVTHCQRMSDRTYAVGARMDRVITAEDVAAARRKPHAA